MARSEPINSTRRAGWRSIPRRALFTSPWTLLTRYQWPATLWHVARGMHVGGCACLARRTGLWLLPPHLTTRPCHIALQIKKLVLSTGMVSTGGWGRKRGLHAHVAWMHTHANATLHHRTASLRAVAGTGTAGATGEQFCFQQHARMWHCVVPASTQRARCLMGKACDASADGPALSTATLDFPTGLALSADDNTLYIAEACVHCQALHGDLSLGGEGRGAAALHFHAHAHKNTCTALLSTRPCVVCTAFCSGNFKIRVLTLSTATVGTLLTGTASVRGAWCMPAYACAWPADVHCPAWPAATRGHNISLKGK